MLLGALGAIFGSFIATIVIRWPAGRSIATGRSACDACGRTLSAAELVPLLSALASRGKCRSCGATIDSLHWRIEVVALAIGASAGLLLPIEAALAAAVFGWLLLGLASLDMTAFWLPDELTLTLALAGIAVGLLGIGPGMTDRLIGGAGEIGRAHV